VTTLPGTLCGFGLLKAGPVVELPDPIIATDKPRPPEDAEPKASPSATPDSSKKVVDL
jgi:hypothetical protein